MTWTLDTPGNHLKVIFFFFISPFLRTFSQIPPLLNVLFFSVPSVAPSGLRVSTLQLSELKVQWNAIPQHSVNGRLLGYVVHYQEYPYHWYNERQVTTSSPDVQMMVLSGLKAEHSYKVWVVGFTRTGTGPRSPSSYHVTTGKLTKSTLSDVRKFKTELVPQANGFILYMNTSPISFVVLLQNFEHSDVIG